MVELAAGDIIMTGTPLGVAATVAGDRIECEIEGVGALHVTIGEPLNNARKWSMIFSNLPLPAEASNEGATRR